jgi:hypothetical protein
MEEDNSEKKLKEIESRWEDNMFSVCSDCMYECIRHWDRNVDCRFKKEDETIKHPDRYNGEIYAKAGADIKFLIEMIKKLKEN